MAGINLETYQNLLKELGDQKYALDQSAIVATTDAKGEITYANDKFCEVSGYSRGELIGQNHRILKSDVHDKSFFQNMWSTIDSGKIWRGEICNRRKNKNLCWVSTTIVPFLTNEGRPYQHMAIRHEITELKQLQKVILDQQAQMISTSKLSAIGEMAATITHEINNPLNVILGRCEMLKNQFMQKDLNKGLIMKSIDAIEKTGQRIERIVKSMKSLAHHGEDEPFSKVKVVEILNDTIELCSERFKHHGIQLSVNLPDVELNINCRSYQIVQILVNLLNNSYDAIENLKEKWINIKISSTRSFVEIAIIDSGSKIQDEVIEKMFHPFFSTKRVQYGTGLGLSVSKGIMRQHGGDLIFDSSGPNTCFKLLFPQKK